MSQWHFITRLARPTSGPRDIRVRPTQILLDFDVGDFHRTGQRDVRDESHIPAELFARWMLSS